MARLSEWLVADGYGACRVLVGTDPTKVENRMAFVEKTPRVRIRAPWYTADDWVNWAARPWKGSGPDDVEARKWCDDMLVLFGHELPA